MEFHIHGIKVNIISYVSPERIFLIWGKSEIKLSQSKRNLK